MDFSKAIPSNNNLAGGIEGFDAAEAAPEFTPIPAGIYSARVLRGEFCSTKAGADAYRLRFEIAEGPQAGKTVVRTWTFSRNAVLYARRDLALFGLTAFEQLLSPFPEPGREYLARLLVAIQRWNDGREFNGIMRIDHVRVVESPAAAFMLPEGAEGGPK